MTDEPENLTLALLREIRKEQADMRSEVTDMRREVTGMRSEVADMRSEVTDMRSEVTGHRGLLLGLSDQVRRIERKLTQEIRRVELQVSDLRDDLEIIVKTEVMGRWAHTETMLEARMNRRFDELRGDREPPLP